MKKLIYLSGSICLTLIILNYINYVSDDNNNFIIVPEMDETYQVEHEEIIDEYDFGDYDNSGFDAMKSVPVIIGKVNSKYGYRKHPILGYLKIHNGVDLKATYKQKVYSPAYGIVKSVSYDFGYGNKVIIDHGNGINTLYAHNAQILVKQGEFVTPETAIALAGSTGLSTGTHLHVEVHYNGKVINPTQFLLKIK